MKTNWNRIKQIDGKQSKAQETHIGEQKLLYTQKCHKNTKT